MGNPITEKVPDMEAESVRLKPGIPAKANDLSDDPIQAGVDLVNQMHNFNREPNDEGKTLSAKVTGKKSKRKKRKPGRSANYVATPAENRF